MRYVSDSGFSALAHEVEGEKAKEVEWYGTCCGSFGTLSSGLRLSRIKIW